MNDYFVSIFFIKVRLVYITEARLSGCCSLSLNISVTLSRIKFVQFILCKNFGI